MKSGHYQNVIGIFVLLIFSAEWVMAQDVTINRFTKTKAALFSRLDVEGELAQRLGVGWNFNLDDNDEEGRVNLEPTIELNVSYAANKKLQGYVSLQYGREMEIEEEDEDRERSFKSSFEVDEGFLQFADLFEIDNVTRKTSLTVGRFNISDRREWFYDKSLDGILASFELEPVDTRITLSINREEIFGSDLLGHNDVDPVNNLIVVAQNEPLKAIDMEIAAYSIVRHDRSADNESPMFFGIGSNGEIADGLISFWADLAWARGDDDDEKINGFGFDVGTTMFLPTRGRPYFTLSYAFGSGDGDTDSDFRQTDLHGNSDKFGGVTSFKYYGELLDPELSNLHIITAGIGFRYQPSASIDFVLHHYTQDVALDELRSANLDEDPDGVSKQLGVELDIIWGVGLTSNIDSEVIFGFFQPGSAFDDDTDNAFLLEAKITYNF